MFECASAYPLGDHRENNYDNKNNNCECPRGGNSALFLNLFLHWSRQKKKKKGLLSSHNLLHVLYKGGGIVTPGTYMAFV